MDFMNLTFVLNKHIIVRLRKSCQRQRIWVSSVFSQATSGGVLGFVFFRLMVVGLFSSADWAFEMRKTIALLIY